MNWGRDVGLSEAIRLFYNAYLFLLFLYLFSFLFSSLLFVFCSLFLLFSSLSFLLIQSYSCPFSVH